MLLVHKVKKISFTEVLVLNPPLFRTSDPVYGRTVGAMALAPDIPLVGTAGPLDRRGADTV